MPSLFARALERRSLMRDAALCASLEIEDETTATSSLPVSNERLRNVNPVALTLHKMGDALIDRRMIRSCEDDTHVHTPPVDPCEFS